MAINIRNLAVGELSRLLNSTPAGEVATDAAVRRLRTRAGFKVAAADDQDRFDLLRLVGWLVVSRHAAIAKEEERATSTGTANRWMSIAECASVVVPPVTADAIRKWCSAGLPFERTGGGGRELRVREADLAAWMRANKPALRIVGADVEASTPAGAQADPRRGLESAIQIGNARAKLEAIRAEQARVKHAKTMGELLDAEDVERTWSTAVGTMSRALEKLPDSAMPAVLRAVAKKLEKLGIASNKAAPAVEELKGEIRGAVMDAVDLIKQRLVTAGGGTNQENPDGEEQEE